MLDVSTIYEHTTQAALTFADHKDVNEELVGWLNARLGQSSLCVKLKVLRLYGQLVQHGSARFKAVLRKHLSDVSSTARLAGLARDTQASDMYASIRHSSKEVLRELYKSDDGDDGDGGGDGGGGGGATRYKADRMKYPGFGNTCSEQGFGNTLPEKSSVISDMAATLVAVVSPQHSTTPLTHTTDYTLNTPVTTAAAASEVLSIRDCPVAEEEGGLEGVLMQQYLHSSDAMVHRRIRTLLRHVGVLDRRRLIYCLKEHLDSPQSRGVVPCLLLLEALSRTNLYTIHDLVTLFNPPLKHLASSHSDHNVIFKARKVHSLLQHLQSHQL